MKKSYSWLLALMLVLSAFLAACSGNDKANSTDDEKDDETPVEETGPVDGGTLTYALSSEFKGLLNWNFYDAETFVGDGDCP